MTTNTNMHVKRNKKPLEICTYCADFNKNIAEETLSKHKCLKEAEFYKNMTEYHTQKNLGENYDWLNEEFHWIAKEKLDEQYAIIKELDKKLAYIEGKLEEHANRNLCGNHPSYKKIRF